MNIVQKFLTPNKYSRPQKPLNKITKIITHWVGNAGSSSMVNWRFFESLKKGVRGSDGKFIYASSHFIIGLDGEVIQCIPENEIAYCSNSANSYSISIECCHPDWSGKFTETTYNALIELCVKKCIEHGLNPSEDVQRHYDITKKDCPRVFADEGDNDPDWIKFKEDLINFYNDLLNPPAPPTPIVIDEWETVHLKWLEDSGLITKGAHTERKIVDIASLGVILMRYNNVELTESFKQDWMKNSIKWLKNKSLIKNDYNGEDAITFSVLGIIIARMLHYNDRNLDEIIPWMMEKGLITTKHDVHMQVSYAHLGVILKRLKEMK
jgi:hypothetical protein